MEGASEIAGIIGSLLTLVITLSDKVLLNKFKRAGAYTADSAIAPGALNPLLNKRLNRFRRSGEVEITPAGKYFINQDIIQTNRRKRRRRAIIIAIVVTVAVVLFLIFK